jgi:hypothetical protein
MASVPDGSAPGQQARRAEELGALRVSELKRMAVAAGAAPAQLDAVDDAEARAWGCEPPLRDLTP